MYCYIYVVEADAKTVLEENIREHCINNSSNDKYWIYMREFANKCQNISTPNFTIECSNNIMNDVGININSINSCIETVKNGIIYLK